MGLELFYGAFMDLTTCRGTGYGTEGPIPWTVVRQWADIHGLDEEQIEDLEYFIPRMDEAYLKFKTKKMTEKTKTPPTPRAPRRRK